MDQLMVNMICCPWYQNICGSSGLSSEIKFMLHIINVVVMFVLSLLCYHFLILFPANAISVFVYYSYFTLFCFILFWCCCFSPGKTVWMILILNQSSEACFVSLFLTEQMFILLCRWAHQPSCCERGKHLEMIKFCYNMVIPLQTLTAPIVFLWGLQNEVHLCESLELAANLDAVLDFEKCSRVS